MKRVDKSRDPVEMARPSRVIITNVRPEIEGGRFAIKRTVGERVVVTADIFSDGHEVVRAVLLYRRAGNAEWRETPMENLGNDLWRGSFEVTELQPYEYTLQAWIDRFRSWRRDLAKRAEAGQDLATDLLIGAELVLETSRRVTGDDARLLRERAEMLKGTGGIEADRRNELAHSEELSLLMDRYPDRSRAATYSKELPVTVDREKARFSAWYEMFPRSCAGEPGRHGTFRDCEKMLEYVASMGFDVLYLPPIHPIGPTFRKGKNNNPVAEPDSVGSPWAIGAKDGGHTAIHPKLGTLEDFRRLVARAREHGLEVALDIAFQCAPDHPWVKEHPEWFRHRPDGTIQHAENPPKKYQDIYPLDFDTEDWQGLWQELKRVFLFWIDQDIRIFRVDNPHTKPFGFWEWVIAELRRDHPDAIFLSEAFTRPKVMYWLAKLGFTQSYTYFAWRNTKWELSSYFTELTRTEVAEYFRPNLWPNTPDILTEYLQFGGRPAFMTRLVLAATLGANYGIYGPAFELCENKPREPGSEEYLNSEKYELRVWDLARPDSLRDLIRRVNQIRRENPALHGDLSLRFHAVDNDELLAYSKSTEDLSNIILVVVNLDNHYTQSGWLDLPLDELGLDAHQPYQVHDLLTDERYLWHGTRNYVQLDPRVLPAHIFRIRRRVRTERDFDYFL
jgi:starch synthase (maltosyl-transferring)